MATEYGGAYGDQPWRDAQPQYPGQSSHDDGPHEYGEGPPGYQAPAPGLRQRRRRPATTAIAGVALALGLIGLAASLFGVITQALPRQFTAGQQREIVNWEFGRNWRTIPAGAIFPASVSYVPPAVLDNGLSSLSARRIGIARQASCRAATDAAAAAVLDRNGCSAVLRATYTDGTSSYVVTVGVAVLPSTAQADRAAGELGGLAAVGGIAPGVQAVLFRNTPAGWFTDSRRQLSGAVWAGTYVALYTVGYADSRPWEPVSGDSYADHEMTSVGLGVARAVLAGVAPTVPTPHCPGTPGC
ncbi:MAG: hypothetical protein ABSA02_18870 [Trebonia sp.]